MFDATFIFGPLSGVTMQMGAPKIPERLFFAPAPEVVTSTGYLLVGYDEERMVEDVPGRVEYVLHRGRSMLEPHHLYPDMEQGVAVYLLAE